MSDRKISAAVEGEARHPEGDVPGLQGCFYVTAGTQPNAAGDRIGVANKGSFITLDAVAPNGKVFSFNLFVSCDNTGGTAQLRIAAQVPTTASTTPLTPGSVLPQLPGPNTNADGNVVGP